MREAFQQYWRGILLTAVGAGATLWLAASGQLGLYIHPSYFVFAAVMSAIAIAVVIVALVLPRQRDHEAHDDAEAEPAVATVGRAWRGRLAFGTSLTILVLTTALLALPPTAVSTALASEREVNAAGVLGGDAIRLAQADSTTFTVRDWAVLIADGASGATLASARPELVGFVMADPDHPESGFAITRFVMLHCAVDVQPVAVEVRLPGWQQQFADGAWVSVQGRFVEVDGGWVLEAAAAVPVDQPADPYVY